MLIFRSGKKKFIHFVIFLLILGTSYAVWHYLFRPKLDFPRSQRDYYQNDPILGYRHRPSVEREFPWPEHPSGRIIMRTNNLGLRRDTDVELHRAPGTDRILVVGDSHFDGVVYNAESFAAVLENTLLNRGGMRPVQVLNAAAGYYGPRHYLQALQAYQELDPQVIIAGFYSGNDFLDAARDAEAAQAKKLDRPNGYAARLRRADRLHSGAVAQMLNQTYYFKTFPHMRASVRRHTAEIFRQMLQRCNQRGMRLWVLILPTKWDIEPAQLPREFYMACSALELQPVDLRITEQMRQELRLDLTTMNVPCWDPSLEMRRIPGPHFWSQDFHLNVRGHQLVAEMFVPRLVSMPWR